MTGADLRAHCLAAGQTQTELAEAAGVSRHTVYRLEGQPQLNPWGWASGRLMDALGVKVVPPKQPNTRRDTRRRGDGVLFHDDAYLALRLDREIARLTANDAFERAHARVPCEACTRKGRPCRLMSEPGRRRCKFHGGRSTGPRTAEGRARIAEAQRRRWAEWRAARQNGDGDSGQDEVVGPDTGQAVRAIARAADPAVLRAGQKNKPSELEPNGPDMSSASHRLITCTGALS